MILLKSLQTIFLRLPWSVTLLCIVILAFCLRLGAWYCDPVISRDGISYIQLAETLRKSDGNFEVLAQMRGEYRQSPFFISILASDIFGASPPSHCFNNEYRIGQLIFCGNLHDFHATVKKINNCVDGGIICRSTSDFDQLFH